MTQFSAGIVTADADAEFIEPNSILQLLLLQ